VKLDDSDIRVVHGEPSASMLERDAELRDPRSVDPPERADRLSVQIV
jgi:hypothetical protein